MPNFIRRIKKGLSIGSALSIVVSGIFLSPIAPVLNATAATVGSGACTQTVSSDSGVEVTRLANDCIVQFKNVGSNSWTAPAGISNVRVLVLGGGGGNGSGGGGAGGFYESLNFPVTPGSNIAVEVGARGEDSPPGATSQQGDNGKSSRFGIQEAGGGGGGGRGSLPSANGQNAPLAASLPATSLFVRGSGGGGSSSVGSDGNGGTGFTAGGDTDRTGANVGGGGGGAQGAGTTGSAGPGKASDITGSSITYAAGSVPAGGTGTVLDTAGSGSRNGSVIVRFSLPKPEAVSGLSVSTRFVDPDNDPDSVSLSWNQAAAQTPAVTGYEIRYSKNSDMSSSQSLTLAGISSTSTTITGLDDGDTYYFEVYAFNDEPSDSSIRISDAATVVSRAVSTEDFALDFDGGNTYLEGNHQVIPAGNDFTFETWLHPVTPLDFRTIVYQGASNGERFAIYYRDLANIHIGRGTASVDVPVGDITDQWTHLAVTVDSSDLVSAYINGQLVLATTLTPSALPSASFRLGARESTNNGNRFDGLLDQVKVWDAPLTPTQVRQSMHSWGATGVSSAPNLIAHYDFNDNTQSSVVRDMASDNDLSVVGATTADFKALVSADTSSKPNSVVYKFTRSYLTSTGGWNVPASLNQIEALIVAGGGAGGVRHAGGGGAGELLYTSNIPLSGTVPVIIGQGGTAVNNRDFGGAEGQDTTLGGYTTTGGGGGFSNSGDGYPGGSPSSGRSIGGSNGGGSYGAVPSYTSTATKAVGPNGEIGLGNLGGKGSSSPYSGGGGGGANSAGQSAGAVGGSGGSGYVSSISGSNVCYSAGGGGGVFTGATPGSGGSCTAVSSTAGAGSAGSATAASGQANTGSGGGGGGNSTDDNYVGNGKPGSGGSGIVVLAYPLAVASATDPANQSALTTETATFSVDASASQGTVSYQWQRKADGETTWTNVGTNSNSYTTPTLALSDNNSQYRVTVSTAINGTTDTTTTNPATLTVSDIFQHFLLFDYNASDLASFNPFNPVTSSTAVNDLSNKNRDGVITTGSGNPIVLENQAFKFDPLANSYIDIPDLPASIDFSNGFTVDFIADFGEVESWERILDIGKGRASENLVVSRHADNDHLMVQIYKGTEGQTGYEQNQVSFESAIQSGLTRYTVVADGTTVELYINGTAFSGTKAEPNGSQARLLNNTDRTSNFVGRGNWSATEGLGGSLRHIRLFNKAFSADLIDDLAVDYKTVQFDPTGGSAVTAMPTSGSLLLPAAPDRAGYVFTGWYSGNNKIGDPEDSYSPTGDIVLNAKWNFAGDSFLLIDFDATDTNSFDRLDQSISARNGDYGGAVSGLVIDADTADRIKFNNNDRILLQTIPSTVSWASGLTLDFVADFGAINPWERIIDLGYEDSKDRIIFGREDSTNNLMLEIWDGSGANRKFSFANALDSINSPSGEHRYTVSYDGTVATLIIDSQTTITGTGSGTGAALPRSINRTKNYIGFANLSGGQFEGTLKYLRLYNAAFGADALSSLSPSFKTVNFTDPTGSTFDLETSGSLRLPSPLSNPGYVFNGWFGEASFDTEIGQPGAVFTPGDTSLFGKATLTNYTVTLRPGDFATGSEITLQKGHDIALSLPTTKDLDGNGSRDISRAGWKITGWSINPDGSTKNFTTSYTANVADVLYPYWEPEDDLVVYFNQNISNDSSSPLTDLAGNTSLDAYNTGFSEDKLGIKNVVVEASASEYLITNDALTTYFTGRSNPEDVSVFVNLYPTTSNHVVLEERGAKVSPGWYDTQIEMINGAYHFRVWACTAVASSIATPLNQWHQIGFVYSDADNILRAYVNGQLAGTITGCDRLTPWADNGATPADVYYGFGSNGGTDMNTSGTFYGGFKIGSIQIYNAPLSAERVAEISDTRTLTFEPNFTGGVATTQQFQSGVSEALTKNAFVNGSRSFSGWNTASDGTGISVADEEMVAIDKDTTLYAIWSNDYLKLESFTGSPSSSSWVDQTSNSAMIAPTGFSYPSYDTDSRYFTFSDTSKSYIYKNQLFTNPVGYSVEIVFRTESANGAKVVGFVSDPVATTSVSYDRHFYIGTDGHLYFGNYNAAVVSEPFRLVKTAGQITDGNWYHALAVADANGTLTLYLNGVQQDQISQAVGQTYNGYWAVGGGIINTWPGANNSSLGFNGDLAVVSVYEGSVASTISQNSPHHNLSWDANGGTLGGNEQQTFITGEDIPKPTNPSKDGYDFAGWSTSEIGGEGDPANLISTWPYDLTATSDTTLHAVWTQSDFSLRFFSEGSVNSTQTVASGASVTPPTISRPGYNLIGWDTDVSADSVEFQTNLSGFTMPPNDQDLYALWQRVDYTLTFDNGGATFSSTTFNIDSSPIANPGNPTITGDRFLGWSTVSADSSQIVSFPYQPPLNTTTLYAVYAVDYSLDFGSNDANRSLRSTTNVIPLNSSFSWEAWIYPTTFANTTWSSILDNGEFGSNFGRTWLQLREESGGFAKIGAGYFADNQSGTSVTTTQRVVELNRWQHVAAVYEITNGNIVIKVYLDGQLMGTSSSAAITGPLPIGLVQVGDHEDPDQEFNGYIDQVKVWDVALDATQITESRSSLGSIGGQNPIALYHFDDYPASATIGSTAKDSSAGGFDLVVPAEILTGVTASAPGRALNDFSVVYDANNGTSAPVDASGYSPFTQAIVADAGTMEKTNFSFSGWNTKADGTGTPVAVGSTLDILYGDITLYAVWSADTYAVTIEAGNLGTGNSLQLTKTAGTPLVLPSVNTNFERTGWEVVGWSTDPDGTSTDYALGANYTTDSDATLYPVWQKLSFTLTFSVDSVTSSQQVEYDTTPTFLGSAPTGYTISGWDTNSASATSVYPANLAGFTMPASASTLYAVLTANSNTVTFKINNGTATADVTQLITTDVQTELTANPFDYPGYDFAGWATSSTGAVVYSDAEQVTINGDLDLFAIWNANTYTVNFVFNDADSGATPASTTYTSGGTAVELPSPGRIGYNFAGWFKDELLTISAGAAGADFVTTENITLYAKWNAIDYQVFYFSTNNISGNIVNAGGSVPVDSNTYNIGDTVPVLSNSGGLNRNGYAFAGWVTNADGTGTALNSGDSLTMGSADINLYPKWVGNTYVISYNANGASGTPSRTSQNYQVPQSAVTDLADVGTMEKTGYDFAGWALTPAGAVISSVLPQTNVTLFAIWTLKDISISYLPGSASGQNLTAGNIANFPSNTTAKFGATIAVNSSLARNLDLNTDTITDHIFFGWSYDSKIYQPGESFILDENNPVFTAIWSPVRQVSYATNGGTFSDGNSQFHDTCTETDNTCSVGQVIALRPAPTRDGYNFLGWEDQLGTTPLYQPNDNFTVQDNNYLLYAKWQAISYTFNFNNPNGSEFLAGATRTIGQQFNFPDPGFRIGYTFGGWQIASDPTSTIRYGIGTTFIVGTEAIDFDATWIPNVYSVSFDWQGGVGTSEPPRNYTVGTGDMPLPAVGDRVKDGFVFAGWAENIGDEPLTSYQPIGNDVLYAVWDSGAYGITFDPFGGTIAVPNISVPESSSITLPLPVRDRFTFIEWLDSNNNPVGTNGDSYTPTATQTLTASWIQDSRAGVDPAKLDNLFDYTTTPGGSLDTTVTHTSGVSVRIQIPTGAFDPGVVFDIDIFKDSDRQSSLISSENDYLFSVLMSWLKGTGATATVPDANAGLPIILTLTDPAIKIGARIYKVIGSQVTDLGVADKDGEVTVEIFEDPEIVVAATKPDAPVITSAIAGDEEVTISWSRGSTGGSDIISYLVTASDGSSCTTATTSCTITGLTNGTSYTFTVTATNAVGTSDPSAPSTAVVPALEVFTVTFDSNGGSTVAASSYPRLGTIAEPTEPNRSGYSFVGWSTTKDDDQTLVSFPYDPAVDQNITLFALWRANPTPQPEEEFVAEDVIKPDYAETGGAIPGSKISFVSSRASEITKLEVSGIEVEFVITADGFEIVVPETLEPGAYDLVVSFGNTELVLKDYVFVLASSSQTSFWTKRVSATEAKVYIKNPKLGFEYSIGHQTGGSGEYSKVMTVTPTDFEDDRLRFAIGSYYLVRTITLQPGINRINVYVDGTPQVLRGLLAPIRYNN